MRSDLMTKGLQRIPHRALFKALGLTDEELSRPIIGVVNAHNEIIPGHIHLNTIAQAVKDGIRMAGGTPIEFPAIGVCDGIAMNHAGMFTRCPVGNISRIPLKLWQLRIHLMAWFLFLIVIKSYQEC